MYYLSVIRLFNEIRLHLRTSIMKFTGSNGKECCRREARALCNLWNRKTLFQMPFDRESEDCQIESPRSKELTQKKSFVSTLSFDTTEKNEASVLCCLRIRAFRENHMNLFEQILNFFSLARYHSHRAI